MLQSNDLRSLDHQSIQIIQFRLRIISKYLPREFAVEKNHYLPTGTKRAQISTSRLTEIEKFYLRKLLPNFKIRVRVRVRVRVGGGDNEKWRCEPETKCLVLRYFYDVKLRQIS
jgi:hypothetical protein